MRIAKRHFTTKKVSLYECKVTPKFYTFVLFYPTVQPVLVILRVLDLTDEPSTVFNVNVIFKILSRLDQIYE